MGVLCDRLKLCSTAAHNSQTGQNKGRYREQERSFLLVSLVRWNSQKCIFFTLQPALHSSVVQAVAYSSQCSHYQQARRKQATKRRNYTPACLLLTATAYSATTLPGTAYTGTAYGSVRPTGLAAGMLLSLSLDQLAY